MTGLPDPAAAGRDRIRAAQADRERVIETLKDAFVYGQLSKDELDARAGRALAARTYADLAALTADIPPVPAALRPARPPVPARRRPLVRAAVGSGTCLTFAAAAVWAAFLLDPGPFASPGPPGFVSPSLMLLLAGWAVLAALCFAAYGVDAAVKQRRSRGHLPPRPGPGGHAPEGDRHGGTGPGPVPSGPRVNETRVDLRIHRSRPRRRDVPAPAGHGVRPVPGPA